VLVQFEKQARLLRAGDQQIVARFRRALEGARLAPAQQGVRSALSVRGSSPAPLDRFRPAASSGCSRTAGFSPGRLRAECDWWARAPRHESPCAAGGTACFHLVGEQAEGCACHFAASPGSGQLAVVDASNRPSVELRVAKSFFSAAFSPRAAGGDGAVVGRAAASHVV
jgi:hypothetical protein